MFTLAIAFFEVSVKGHFSLKQCRIGSEVNIKIKRDTFTRDSIPRVSCLTCAKEWSFRIGTVCVGVAVVFKMDVVIRNKFKRTLVHIWNIIITCWVQQQVLSFWKRNYVCENMSYTVYILIKFLRREVEWKWNQSVMWRGCFEMNQTFWTTVHCLFGICHVFTDVIRRGRSNRGFK